MSTEPCQRENTLFDKIGYEFYRYTPYKHQLSTIVTLLKNKRCYNLSDMGAGKTASTIWAYDILRFSGKVKNMLVICPLSIMHAVWVKELRNISPHLKYAIMHGPRKDRIAALESGADVIITNHDCVRTYSHEIINKGIDIIVIDELTAYKHHGSARSKEMNRIAKCSNVVWGLTGSPITTGPMDAYSLARIVNPERLPTPYMSRYRNMVMYKIDMYNYEPKPGWENFVHKILQPAIRFNIDECIDLPPITYETRRVEMARPVKNAYNNMLKEHIAEVKNGTITAVNAGVKFSKLLQFGSGTVIDENGKVHRLDITPKYNELKSIIYESGNKLIIFCQFVDTVLFLDELLTKDQFTTRIMYGKIPVKVRAKYIDEFQDGPVEVLIAQVSTASHGFTLTVSNHICYWSAIMGVEKYIQSIARIRRPGQTQHQHIIRLESCRAEQKLFEKLESGKLDNASILDMYGDL